MPLRPRADQIPAVVVAALVFAALVLVLALPSDMLLTGRDTDMVSEFVSFRAYYADSLGHGHIPLWNPYTYGGQPFLAGFEAAVLYPLNLIFLILPLARALNFSLLLHLILLGWGMERWARSRDLHPWAAALAGLVVPLSGSVFPHLFAGHLSNICTLAWAPWIFLGLESWVQRGDRHGLFLASVGVCMQILAGHIQYFFYTAVAVGLQALLLTIAQPSARRRALPAVVGCYLAALALGAAQLLPGLAASREGVRQSALDYDFAAMFGFPPENFLTVIAPGFFGSLVEPRLYDQPGQPIYWGRCYLWEMTIFIGAATPLLIAIGVALGQRRQALLDLAAAALLLVLALGVHTPVFDLFYHFVPGFDHFRSWSKFIFPATLFLVLVMATGADALLRGKSPPRAVAWTGLIAGGIALLAGSFIFLAPDSLSGFLQFIASTRESYLPPQFFGNAGIITTAGTRGGLSLALGGCVLLTSGFALLHHQRHPLLRYALPAIIALEMLGFAAGTIPSAQLSDAMPDELRKFVAANPGDYRVLNLIRPDNGFLLGAGDINGNDPTVLRRYAEFMTFTQGADPDHATQYIPFKGLDPLYAMLRLRYVFAPTEQGLHISEATPAPLPRLLLISDWRLAETRDAVFTALRDPAFRPASSVVLETKPEPAPMPGPAGTVRLVSEQPNELVIEADTTHPTVLLVTDLYDQSWRAEPLAGSAQTAYQILPANYILRAIPLAAGHHRLRLVYAPTAFPIGVTISLVAWLAWIGLYFRWARSGA